MMHLVSIFILHLQAAITIFQHLDFSAAKLLSRLMRTFYSAIVQREFGSAQQRDLLLSFYELISVAGSSLYLCLIHSILLL